ncbi:MAG: hypothetical protein RMM29_00165 [Planctomycetota bacterium]|nr:hypothetical protein [Planctomycetota bacterium]MCX8039283.1 hypothetical protein [Planctomycetota bacterium]MDW8372048.1 hypothetical protein [Planctomycetota bacterium]
MLRPLLPLCALALLSAGEARPKPLDPEPFRDGTREIEVSNVKERTLTPKADPEGLDRYVLWYRGFDNGNWGAWQRHGQAYPKGTPVVWAPPEGHWQVHLQVVLTSGLPSADPAREPDKIKAHKEFIIDRSSPRVAIGFPGAGAKLRGGDKYTVRWTASDAYLRTAPIAIRWSVDGGASWATVASELANAGSFEWTVPRDMTTTGVLRIEAADKAGNVGFADVAGILVDSIRPRGRVLGPAISNRQETALDLEVNDQGPAGLSAARLWVSQDDGVSWVEGPTIAAPFKQVSWRAPQDGVFRLYVVATDGAGNVTQAPQGKVGETIIVDTSAPTVLLASAIGISDAAAPAPGRRDFKPGDRVQVVFTVKDANLQPNSISVLWQMESGKPWVELGRNLPHDQAFRFQIPNDVAATKSARIKVTAADLAGNVGEAVAAEAFTIQTLAQIGDIVIE